MGVFALALGLTIALADHPAPQADPLARARQLYNGRQFDEAMAAAGEAHKNPKLADASELVLARALLERYRLRQEPDDLVAAREALKQINTLRLSPRDQVDYAVGLGESLYFEERFGPAAESFDLALTSRDGPQGDERDRVFEWWAASLDQQAQFGPDGDRRPIYGRLLDRAAAELSQNPQSAVATYWIAASARGADDISRAWSAAVSGWIRAQSLPDRGAALRADLDRLVIQAIIPERARRLAPNDPQSAIPGLRQEWEKIKKDWEESMIGNR